MPNRFRPMLELLNERIVPDASPFDPPTEPECEVSTLPDDPIDVEVPAPEFNVLLGIAQYQLKILNLNDDKDLMHQWITQIDEQTVRYA
jgi:hypothetical protein